MRVLPPAADGPLLPWLLAALAPMPRTRVKQLPKFGRVTVNGVPVTGGRVELESPPPPDLHLGNP